MKIRRIIIFSFLLTVFLATTVFGNTVKETENKIREEFSDIIFDEHTLSACSGGGRFEYEVAQWRLFTPCKLKGSSTAGASAYMISHTYKDEGYTEYNIDKIVFPYKSYLFITKDELVINGKRYFICVNYQSNAGSVSSSDKDIKAALTLFISDFSKSGKTGNDLARIAERDLASLKISYQNINGIRNAGWTTAMPEETGEGGNYYRFTKTGPFLNLIGDDVQASVQKDSQNLSNNLFTVPICAFRNQFTDYDGRDRWILCSYDEHVNGTSEYEVQRAFDEMESFSTGKSLEEVSEDPSTYTPPEGSGSVVNDNPGSYASLSKDPLSYLDDFSYKNNSNSIADREIKGFTSGFYNFLSTVAIIAFGCSLILGCITLIIKGYTAKNQVAESILAKGVILIVIAGAAGFFSMIISLIEIFS